MTDLGLGDDATNEDKRAAAVKWHFGTYYYQSETARPVDLLANPPFAGEREHGIACGTGAFFVEAQKRVEGAT